MMAAGVMGMGMVEVAVAVAVAVAEWGHLRRARVAEALGRREDSAQVATLFSGRTSGSYRLAARLESIFR